MDFVKPPRYGPLPSADPDAPGFKGAIFLMIPYGYGLTSLAERNGIYRSNQIDVQRTQVFELMFQFVLETFKECGDSGGGIVFVNRLPKEERIARQSDPYQRLVGPYMTDVCIALTATQASQFMTLFRKEMEPLTEEPQPRKRRKRMIHQCSRIYVRSFERWTNALSTFFPMIYDGTVRAADVLKEYCISVPGEEGSVGDLLSLTDPRTDDYKFRGAHPLVMFEMRTMFKAIARSDPKCFEDLAYTDFVVIDGDGGGVARLKPSKKLQDAAVCIPMRPVDAIGFFMETDIAEQKDVLDAAILSSMAPLYLTPPDRVVDELVQQSYNKSFSKDLVYPKDFGFGPNEALAGPADGLAATSVDPRWMRRMVSGQWFSDAERTARKCARVGLTRVDYLPQDPLRTCPVIMNKEQDGGGGLGDSVLDNLYSRLRESSRVNAAALDAAVKKTPINAFRVIKDIVSQTFTVCNIENAAGIPPNLSKVLRRVQHDLGKLQVDSDFENRQNRLDLLISTNVSHDRDDCDTIKCVRTIRGNHNVTPSTNFIDWILVNMTSHGRLKATQLPVFLVCYASSFRVTTDSRKGLCIAFLGDPGVGKSHVQSDFFGNSNYPFYFMSSGSTSEQGEMYSLINEDNVNKIEDESALFDPSAKQMSAAKKATVKTALEERVQMRETTEKVVGPDGSERIQGKVIRRSIRGNNYVNANDVPENRAIRDRFTTYHVSSIAGGGGGGKVTKDCKINVFPHLSLFHGISQLIFLPRHFVSSNIFQSDASIVDLFFGLLDQSKDPVGGEIPENRRREDVKKMAESYMIMELAHVFTTDEIRDGEFIRFERADLERFMFRAQPLSVISPEATVAAYTTLYPAQNEDLENEINEVLYNGSCFEVVLSEGSESDSYKYPWSQKLQRVENNTGLALQFKSPDELASHIYSQLGHLSICPGEKSILEVIKRFAKSKGASNECPLFNGRIVCANVKTGKVQREYRVAVSNRAVQEHYSKLELAIISALLDIISAAPQSVLRFTADGHVLIPLVPPKAAQPGCAVYNALLAFDPMSFEGSVAVESPEFYIIDGVRKGRIREPTARVQTLLKLFKTGNLDASLGEPELLTTHSSDRANQLYEQTSFYNVACLMQGKNMFWTSSNRPAVKIVEAAMENVFPYGFTNEGRGNNATLFGSDREFYEQAGMNSFIDVDLSVAVNVIDRSLMKSLLPLGLASSIQSLYRACHSTRWLTTMKPSIFAGTKLKRSGRKVVQESILLKYAHSEEPIRVEDPTHVDTASNSQAFRVASKSAEESALADLNLIFPGRSQNRELAAGGNYYARAVVYRFCNFFGSGWIGNKTIEDLISRQMWENDIGDVMEETFEVLQSL